MSTVTFRTIEDEIKKRFGDLPEAEMDQQFLELAPVIGVDPHAEEISLDQYQKACQLLEIIHQQRAMTFVEANQILEGGTIEVAPHNELQQSIDAHAALIVDEFPIQVADAKEEMQQGIRHALAERVAQKLSQTDINAKVEEIMKQRAKKPQPSFLELIGITPLPTQPEPKQLPGS